MVSEKTLPSLTWAECEGSPLSELKWATSRTDIITLYWDGHLSDHDLCVKFNEWSSRNVYCLLQERQAPLDREPRILCVKSARRGNDVYRWRCRQRFKPVMDLCESKKGVSLVDPHHRFEKSRILFFTLTWNPSLCGDNVHDSWRAAPTLFNEFLSKLKAAYGSISEIRCMESFQLGYPHYHFVVVFKDHEFVVQRYVAKHGKKRGQIRYILSDHDFENMREFWFNQHVNVEACQSFGSIPYLVKYITKGQYSDKAGITAARLWLYGKRSYSVSSDLCESLELVSGGQRQLDTIMHNSNGIMQESYDDSIFVYLGSVELSTNVELWRFAVDPPPFEEHIPVSNPDDYQRMLSAYCEYSGLLHPVGDKPGFPVPAPSW